MEKILYDKNDIKLTLVSDLMENHFVESKIDSAKGLKSLSFENTQTCCFFINKENQLGCVINDFKTRSGWSYFILSDEKEMVSAFDVFQDKQKGSFQLAYAVKINEEACFLKHSEALETKHIYKLLSNQEEKVSFSMIPFNDSRETINELNIHKLGITFATLKVNEDAKFHYYTFNDQSEGIKSFALPEHGSKIKQVQIGTLGKKNGFYMLYDIGTSQTLSFREYLPGKATNLTQRFSTGKKIEYFTLIYNENGSSELFTSGEGIFRFKGLNTSEEIVPATNGFSYGKIEMEVINNKVFAWVIGKNDTKSGLYYFTNAFHSKDGTYKVKGQWTTPLLMHDDVNYFATCSDDVVQNKLFISTSNNEDQTNQELSLFWQDPITSFWDEQPVSIDNLKNVIEKETYTISFHLQAKDLNLENVTFSLSSDESTYLYVNNIWKFLTPTKPIPLNFEAQQVTQIIIPIEGFNVPDFTIKSNIFEEDLHFSVAMDTLSQLQDNFSSKETIRSLKKSDGSSFIDEKVSNDDLDNVSNFMKEIKKMSDDKNKEKTILRASFSDENALEYDLGFSFGDLISSVGDVLHAIKEGFITAANFVVEKVKDGVKFIITIAGQVFDFVLEKIKSVLNAIGEIFKKIGAFFKDLFELLGFLFEWKDIIITKNVLKEFGLEKIKEGKSHIESLKHLLKEQVNNVRLTLEEQKNALDHKYNKKLSFSEFTSGASGENGSGNTDNKVNWLDSKKDVVFGNSTKLKASDEDVTTISEAAKKNSIPAEILDLFIGVIMGNITFTEFIEKVTNALARLAMDMLDFFIDKIFDWLISIYDTIFKIFTQELEIPLISYLYRKVSGSELSLIDAIALLVAIPMTIGYKIEFIKAPFKQGDVLVF